MESIAVDAKRFVVLTAHSNISEPTTNTVPHQTGHSRWTELTYPLDVRSFIVVIEYLLHKRWARGGCRLCWLFVIILVHHSRRCFTDGFCFRGSFDVVIAYHCRRHCSNSVHHHYSCSNSFCDIASDDCSELNDWIDSSINFATYNQRFFVAENWNDSNCCGDLKTQNCHRSVQPVPNKCDFVMQ